MPKTELEATVHDQLLGDASVDASRIKIQVDGTSVTLSGVVDTLHQKLRAEEDTRRLTGVRHVTNDLIVNKSHDRVSDADLKATARAGLDANGLVPKDALTLDVTDGWITVTGNVGHYYQRQAIEHVVRHLTGLQGVTDAVTVSKDPAVDVSKAITSALSRTATVDGDAVEVTDTDGAVTLTGSVKNVAEKEEAERAAASAPGVVSVTNELVVTG